MMLSRHGKEATTDSFLYFLARELGKTVAELEDLSYAEYVDWVAYFEVQAALESVRR